MTFQPVKLTALIVLLASVATPPDSAQAAALGQVTPANRTATLLLTQAQATPVARLLKDGNALLDESKLSKRCLCLSKR
jgi:hypothetical protein